MAITGSFASYIPTMDEFIAHWNNANTVLGVANFIVLPINGGPMWLNDFQNLRASLAAQEAVIQDKLNDCEIARADIAIKKAQLLQWFNQFTGLMDAYYVGTKFMPARPNAPSVRDGREVFTKPMYDAASLWRKLNAADARPGLPLPIMLSDGALSEALFTGTVAALEAAYIEDAACEQNLALARVDRTLLQATAYETMKMYRQAVPTKCASHPNLVATLPRLTPEPGSTPDALSASAIFQAPDAAKIVHSTVEQAGIKKVQLRGHVGAKWEEDNAITIAEHAPDATPEFTTNFGLTQPGVSAVFKVYVINETDNEAGSAAMLVTRPV